MDGIPLDPAQQAFIGQPLEGVTDLLDSHGQPVVSANGTKLATFADGQEGIVKPQSGEGKNVDLNEPDPDPPEKRGWVEGDKPFGDLWRNELAASKLSRRLGFNDVPETAPFVGPDGPGSIQLKVDHVKVDIPTFDNPVVRQRMGIFDYIMGNADRHPGNMLKRLDGSPALIDNGASLPKSVRPQMRSDQVAEFLNKPLDAELLEKVRNVNPADVRAEFEAIGIPEESIKGALGRLSEIQTHGMITGGANPGGCVIPNTALGGLDFSNVKVFGP